MSGLFDRKAVFAAAPYLAWMALMFALPATAGSYAVRGGVAALALAAAFLAGSFGRAEPRFALRMLVGIAAGLLVLALWVCPEQFEWYRRFCVIGGGAESAGPSPYDPSVCGWPLTLARLAGSAFVIAPAEELFFRSFLYRRLQSRDWTDVDPSRFDVSAFLWTVGLFALEHDRIVAGAAAGAIYGLVAMRCGLGAAVTAHVVTNLALGLYVVKTGAWAFW
ncbi:MAG: CAAX prenyl protease-related protein [Kiritimatiellae bacterium]|nr:CAAX prenyl protease-related protein [Kiritimatiellia bacterium]